MNELFSRISGQLSGPVLASTSLPVLLFFTVLTLVVLPITPYGHDFTEAVMDPKAWAERTLVVLMLTMAMLVAAIVLSHMNTQIVRLYEGYSWKDSWIGRLMQRHQLRYFDQATALRTRIKKLRTEIRQGGIRAPLSSIESQTKLATSINNYPSRKSILPTRLGNAIRAFEKYPERQYKISAIALWPRLRAVVDGKLAESLDDAKAAFDFMIHSAFLSGLLAYLTAASGLYWKTRAAHLSYEWIILSLAFAAISYFFYNAAIYRAIEWGSQVKAAFDLYRLPLLEKLGFESKPTDLKDERRIWDNLSNGFVFPDSRDVFPDIPYKQPSSYLDVDPPSVIVKSTRTVKLIENGILEIKLVVCNQDPTAYVADRVIVCEDVPSGKAYVFDSAKVDKIAVSLLSMDPIKIDLGKLENRKSRTVVYQIKGGA